MRTLGAVIAGGRSRRFGSPKSAAVVGGRLLPARVADSLRAVIPDVVVIANEPRSFAALGLDVRPDAVPGAGPLAGVVTALRWSRELGCAGALCVAGDMPFVPRELLAELLALAGSSAGSIVAPPAQGRHPYEPLCAWYPVAATPVLEDRLRGTDRSLRRVGEVFQVQLLPEETVRRFGDPRKLFHNVNTVEDLRMAEALARSEVEGDR